MRVWGLSSQGTDTSTAAKRQLHFTKQNFTAPQLHSPKVNFTFIRPILWKCIPHHRTRGNGTDKSVPYGITWNAFMYHRTRGNGTVPYIPIDHFRRDTPPGVSGMCRCFRWVSDTWGRVSLHSLPRGGENSTSCRRGRVSGPPIIATQ